MLGVDNGEHDSTRKLHRIFIHPRWLEISSLCVCVFRDLASLDGIRYGHRLTTSENSWSCSSVLVVLLAKCSDLRCLHGLGLVFVIEHPNIDCQFGAVIASARLVLQGYSAPGPCTLDAGQQYHNG